MIHTDSDAPLTKFEFAELCRNLHHDLVATDEEGTSCPQLDEAARIELFSMPFALAALIDSEEKAKAIELAEELVEKAAKLAYVTDTFDVGLQSRRLFNELVFLSAVDK